MIEKQGKWFEVVFDVETDAYENALDILFQLGAAAVEEEAISQGIRLKTCFDPKASTEIQKRIQETLSGFEDKIKPTFREKLDDGWMDKYKEYFFPQPMSRLFYLVPAWVKDAEIPAGSMPIYMEAGQAFGTGIHPSTKLALRLMERCLEHGSDPKNVSMLDVGTGTGILSIAARKLGVKKITSVETDEPSIDVAKENFERNQVDGIDLHLGSVEKAHGQYPLIVANILLETHLELLPKYLEHLHPQGHLILAGLLGHQREQILGVLKSHGMAQEFSESMQEWWAAAFIKKDN